MSIYPAMAPTRILVAGIGNIAHTPGNIPLDLGTR